VHKIQVRNLFPLLSLVDCGGKEVKAVRGKNGGEKRVVLVVNLHILHINKTDFVAGEASAEMSQHKMAKEAPNKYKIK